MIRSANKFILYCLITLSLLLTASAEPRATLAAPTQQFSEIDAYINAQMEKHWIPGVALAIVQGTEVVYLKGYGVDARGVPITPQTPMFIGSQSKSFTALAIAQLIDAGKLKLSDPVRQHIPWFAVADEAASAEITLNHLLHHTSGLSEAGFTVVLPDTATPEQAVRALASARLTAPVGQKFQYFNAGYDVLAYLVEVTSGQPYATYIAKHILEPLGMTRSTADVQNLSDVSQGFTRFYGFPLPMAQRIPAYEVGAGYIVSTAEDLARYALAIQALDAGRGGALLSARTARLMFQPGLGEYGLGWNINDHIGTRHISHGGANETFHTYVDVYPQRDLALVLITNVGHQTDHYLSSAQLFAGVQAILLGQTVPPVADGWSVKWLGWSIGLFVLALSALQVRNFLVLRGWAKRARSWSPTRRAWVVAISFIIPTVILLVLAWQLSSFYGYRFNWLTNALMLPIAMPDIALLMVIGTIPDYAQGILKLYWVLTGQPDLAHRTTPSTTSKTEMRQPAIVSKEGTR